jgi:RimJ/RimL family protein N-acetyltransferase
MKHTDIDTDGSTDFESDPEDAIRSNYDFQLYDEESEVTVSFRKATMEEDLGRLHAWLGSEHVKPYWQLDLPLPEFRDRFAEKLADDHLTPYVGYIDHVPMSYFEQYWAAEDDVAQYYDAEEDDQGVHMLIGPEEYVGKGYSHPLVRIFGMMLGVKYDVQRAILEPDVRNEKMRNLLEQSGFETIREFYFEEEEKEAALMMITRETFEEAVFDGSVSLSAPRASDD